MTGDPFARDRAKTRRRFILGATTIVVVIAAVVGIRWWRSPDRVMDKNRAFIEQTRARYCKVLDNEKRTEPAARVALQRSSEPREIKSLGHFLFDDHDFLERRDGTLDEIQLDGLETLCAGKSPNGQSLHSVFSGIVDPNEARRGHYTKSGLARAVAAMERVEYLLVVRLSEMTQTIAVGEKGLAPGRFKAHAAVWRLSDGAYVDGADIAGDGPSFAFVDKGDEDLQLAVKTSDALRDAITRALATKGLAVKLR